MENQAPRALSRVVSELFTLNPADFDDFKCPNYYEFLEPLVLEIVDICPPGDAANILLAFAEKMDGCDFGSPGPLVRAIESLENYLEPLAESIRRHPTDYAIWMVNRYLNTIDETSCGQWLVLLREAMEHPRASKGTKEMAQHFLEYQLK
jgi:hypothetical protein